MCKNNNCVLACGIISTVLFAGFFAGIFVWDVVFLRVFRNQVAQNIILDGPGSFAYGTWNTSNFPNAPAIYEEYHLFNYTNVEEIRNGGTPKVQPIGPFTYKFNRQKFDVEWLEDNNKVKYNDWVYYNFAPELSVADPKNVDITFLNPPYLGVLSQTKVRGYLTKGEATMIIAYTAVEFRKFFNFFQTTLIPDAVDNYSPALIQTVMNQYIDDQVNNHGSSHEAAFDSFLQLWANDTTASGNPGLDAVRLAVVLGKSSNIGMQAAKKLFDVNWPNSFYDASQNLFNTSIIKSWRHATASQRADYSRWFGLSQDQVTQITQWLDSAAFQKYALNQVPRLLGVESVNDFPCYQWGQGGVTQTKSLWEYYPSEFVVGAPPEFYFYSKTIIWQESFTIGQCRQMFTVRFEGPGNLTDPKNFGDFLQALGAKNYNETEARWGFTANATIEFGLYVAEITRLYNYKDIQARFDSGRSGLFVTRKAQDWVWDYSDPLMLDFLPFPPPLSFKHNQTDMDAARDMWHPNIVYTGKNNVSQIQDYYAFRGYHNIDWLYPENLVIDGKTEEGQFQPFLNETSKIAVFEEEYLRYYPMRVVDKVEIEGISALRFSPINDTLLANKFYDMYISGFANMSAQFNGTPIFLCNPNFFASPPEWQMRVEGVVTNITTDMIRLDIEPNTGKIIGLWKGVQINLYIPSDTPWFNWYNPSMARGRMFPLMVAYQYFNITSALVDLIKGKVYLGLTLGTVIKWSLVGLTALMGCLAIGMFALFARRRRAGVYGALDEYEPINT